MQKNTSVVSSLRPTWSWFWLPGTKWDAAKRRKLGGDQFATFWLARVLRASSWPLCLSPGKSFTHPEKSCSTYSGTKTGQGSSVVRGLRAQHRPQAFTLRSSLGTCALESVREMLLWPTSPAENRSILLNTSLLCVPHFHLMLEVDFKTLSFSFSVIFHI